MNKRLRYYSDGTDFKLRFTAVSEDGERYIVWYSGKGSQKTETKGWIQLESGELPALEFTATSHHKIKIKLKRALEKLGCKFEKETRKVKDSE